MKSIFILIIYEFLYIKKYNKFKKNDVIHGEGVYTFANGNKYEGIYLYIINKYSYYLSKIGTF